MKQLIDTIIRDLGDDKPINGILLKAQILASHLNNSEFSSWIRNEQNGYPDASNLPTYRVLGAILKADVQIPWGKYVAGQTIPTGIFDNEVINDCMSHARIINSLAEIESKSQGIETENLRITLPAMAYVQVNKYVNGYVQKVYQEIPVSSILNIINVFKSKLLDFFLKINKELDAGIDFSNIEGQKKIEQIMNNYNINAAVVNTGSGSVTTHDVTASNFEMNITADIREKMQDIISQMESIVQNSRDKELLEAYQTLKEETQNSNWIKKTIRMALNAIKGIATGITANQLSPLVTQGLALLA